MFSEIVITKRSIRYKRRVPVIKAFLVSVFLCFPGFSAIAGQGSINISVMPPSELAVSVDFNNTTGDKSLEAGGRGTLIITVINNGKTVARNVTVHIAADRRGSRVEFPSSVDFGNIDTGKMVKKEIELHARNDMRSGTVGLNISVTDSNGFDSGVMHLDIGLRTAKNPKLVVHDFGINDKDKDLKIEPKERVVLTVRIKNIGGGVARKVRVEIHYGKDVTICGSGISTFDIGELKPGRYEDVRFNFFADKGIKRGERIPIDVKITEERPEHGSTIPLDIEMFSPQNSSERLNQ